MLLWKHIVEQLFLVHVLIKKYILHDDIEHIMILLLSLVDSTYIQVLYLSIFIVSLENTEHFSVEAPQCGAKLTEVLGILVLHHVLWMLNTCTYLLPNCIGVEVYVTHKTNAYIKYKYVVYNTWVNATTEYCSV